MNNKYLLNLVDKALHGEPRSISMAVQKLSSHVRTLDEELYFELVKRLSNNNLRSIDAKPIPVDSDSRMQLIKIENNITLEHPPILSGKLSNIFSQVILERNNTNVLIEAGLSPSKALLFQGPPGVGKTMSARWLAEKLNLPLLILDLATVMSSFLGKTGSNIRSVLDHASSFPCVLLLDEFDAIAKRRDDDRELGELKRLVTVLLQAIDEWPESSLLIAATNHGELLDPAIWRRFDIEIDFKLPTNEMISNYLEEYWPEIKDKKSQLRFHGKSFSDIDRDIKKDKRAAVLSTLQTSSCLFEAAPINAELLSMNAKKEVAKKLHNKGFSQREISKRTGLSRPTVKKAISSL